MGGSSECGLLHSTSHDGCGSGSPFTGSPFTVTPVTGFGTSATSFTSTLSGTASPTLDGTLVECFGPDLDRDPIGMDVVQILG